MCLDRVQQILFHESLAFREVHRELAQMDPLCIRQPHPNGIAVHDLANARRDRTKQNRDTPNSNPGCSSCPGAASIGRFRFVGPVSRSATPDNIASAARANRIGRALQSFIVLLVYRRSLLTCRSLRHLSNGVSKRLTIHPRNLLLLFA